MLTDFSGAAEFLRNCRDAVIITHRNPDGEKYPCYYTTGNHEEWSGEVDNIKKIVAECGVKVMAGEYVDFSGIRVCGADNSLPASQYSNCVNAADKGLFTIMMSHRPDRVNMYSGNGFDLVVCGHAHGGQGRLFGIGLIAPDQGFFPKYTSGLYEENETKLIVSRGIGNSIAPVRIFDRPHLIYTVIK